MCCGGGAAEFTAWVHLPEVLVRAVAGLFFGAVEPGKVDRPSPSHEAWKSLPARFALLAIREYQLRISARTPAHCRFVPSCSAYAATAIGRFGFLSGLRRACDRLRRCRSSVPGATLDPVPRGTAAPRAPRSPPTDAASRSSAPPPSFRTTRIISWTSTSASASRAPDRGASSRSGGHNPLSSVENDHEDVRPERALLPLLAADGARGPARGVPRRRTRAGKLASARRREGDRSHVDDVLEPPAGRAADRVELHGRGREDDPVRVDLTRR